MPPRLLADEMVGSLARWLRMMGCDTAYARGWSDDDLLRRARLDGRIVLTRDRELAQRADRVLLLESPRLEDQVRAVWLAFADVPREVRFERCALCNGVLAPYSAPSSRAADDGIPWDRVARGLPLFRCPECGQVYWEGSHSEEIRRRLRRWAEAPAG